LERLPQRELLQEARDGQREVEEWVDRWEEEVWGDQRVLEVQDVRLVVVVDYGRH